jgi:hypothetical protein
VKEPPFLMPMQRVVENRVISRVAVDGAGLGATAGDPTVLDRYSRIGGQRFLQLGTVATSRHGAGGVPVDRVARARRSVTSASLI